MLRRRYLLSAALVLAIVGIWQVVRIMRGRPSIIGIDQRWADQEGRPNIRG